MKKLGVISGSGSATILDSYSKIQKTMSREVEQACERLERNAATTCSGQMNLLSSTSSLDKDAKKRKK